MAENPFDVPRWLQNHPELQRRGIVLTDCLKPTYVYGTTWFEEPSFAVKILELDDEEADICRRLRRTSDPRNHTIPCEVIDGGDRPILLMPYLLPVDLLGSGKWSLSQLLSYFLQVVEGIEYLHDQRIAHLDVCNGNIVAATAKEANSHPRVTADRIYIIDFHTSRQLSLGPGAQGAIPLPRAQIRPPDGVDSLDPYSWDVYCLGKLLESMAQLVYYDRPSNPWIVSRIIAWLVGQERGCRGVCRCRPTARRTRQLLSVLQWLISVYERCTQPRKSVEGNGPVSTTR